MAGPGTWYCPVTLPVNRSGHRLLPVDVTGHIMTDEGTGRPSLLDTGSAVTITEQVARRREPCRISKATSHVHLLGVWSEWGKFRPRPLGTGNRSGTGHRPAR
ncbi:hypothetical protein DPMN_062008 [Dreissena polymorpha]|uniref:Uncharacterized protein n=1 Tax=Dreissena polymorpha TaxID=45954 RepID=A0A9D4C8T5_DREPO|nr:hypothetical protein DPMN_062008 [Dreissena polymorpha]